MFRNLIDFWKGRDFLKEAFTDFGKMLTDAQTTFTLARDRLRRKNIEGTNVKDRIYEIDKNINAYEKRIRTRILEHLAVQPNVDLTASLVLMSVVKDAERLGDYSKNLYEVSEMLAAPFDETSFRELFDNMDNRLVTMFEKTHRCFLESDEKTAHEIMDIERSIVRGCDAGVKKLAQSTLATNRAVCAALIFRYFKRFGAHLANIASSVIMPLSDLDFFDEKRRNDSI